MVFHTSCSSLLLALSSMCYAGLHSSIEEDMRTLLQGKSYKELMEMKEQVQRRIDGKVSLSMPWWLAFHC